MVIAFPLGKLLYLGVKQVSRPIASQLKNAAVRSPIFKKYVCAPPAQLLHRLEVFVKMRLMGVQGPTEVQALKPDKAAEIGAELIGEFFVYSFAASIVLFEYWRSSQKEQHQDEVQDSKIAKLHVTVGRLDGEVVELKKRLELLESVKSEMSRKQG